MDAYDSSLIRTSAPELSAGRYDLGSAQIGNYVIFAGGTNISKCFTTAEAYDSSLTKTSAADLSVGRFIIAGTSLDNYAIFAGGGNNYGGSDNNTAVCYSAVDAYNSSLTRTSAPDLSVSRRLLTASKSGNYALVAGGLCFDGKHTAIATVDAYDSSLTRTSAPGLSEARYLLESESIKNCAIFGGGAIDGSGSNPCTSTVDAYIPSLTKINAPNFKKARLKYVSTVLGDYALFGSSNSSDSYKIIEPYTYNDGYIP